MDTNEFRKHGHDLVDWIANYMDNIEKYPVQPNLNPGEIKNKLPKIPPKYGESMDKIFKDFESLILPGITHWQHPSWFAYFPANNSPPSILAEFLSAGLGVQCMIWKTSPAAEELEDVTMDWLRQLIGLPKGYKGVIQDTASTANLVALITAREKITNFQVNKQGFKETLCVYCSEEAHSSIIKGAKIAGYGLKNIRLIPTDNNFAMIPKELEKAIISDKESGLKPTCVCATIGTTSSTGVDPLNKIGPICQKHGLWLHTDAAFAGTAAMLPEKRWIMKGCEYVDSFVFNPHKWMLTNFDCSAYFVKDPKHLQLTFNIHPEYLKTGVDAKVNNYRDWGIQLGRRFRSLKLWFVIRSYGAIGLQEIIREHIRQAEILKQLIEKESDFEIMAPVYFSLVCFRYNPGNKTEKELDEINRQLIDLINKTGKILLTQTTLKDKFVIRFSIGQRTTKEKHVKKAWELITKTVKENFQ